MSGDYTRFTLQPRKRYPGVLMQQGRVQLDADWNEGVEITARRWAAPGVDTFGGSAVPQTTPTAFQLTALAGPPPDLAIGIGRFYVDGLLAEVLDDEVFSYLHQPFLPRSRSRARSQTVALARRHRLPRRLEARDHLPRRPGDPGRGARRADTTTRVQIAWQVNCSGPATIPPSAAPT